MGSLLDIDVNDAQEPKVLEAGEEVKLRITRGETGTDKNDEPYMIVGFEIPNEPFSKDFTQFFRLPHADMTEKQRNRAKWELKLFGAAFGIPSFQNVDVEDFVGNEGWAILGVREDDTYGENNTIRKFIAPK